MQKTIAALLSVLPLIASPAWADDPHDRARRAARQGQVVPLSVILERVARDNLGEVISTELEDEHGKMVYEIKVITPSGRVTKLYFDAADGSPVSDGQRRHR